MKTIRKISALLALGLASLAILVLVFLAAFPHLVSLKPIKRSILLRLSSLAGGQIHYQSIRIEYLPRPELVFQRASLTLPDRLGITSEEIRVLPAVIPLLQGRVELRAIDLRHPRMEVSLPAQVSGETAAAIGMPAPAAVYRDLMAWTSHPLFQKAGLRYTIQGGTLTLNHPVDGELNFDDIQAHIRRNGDRLALELRCRSNLWNALHLQGQIETSGEPAEVHLTLKDFQPHRASTLFLASTTAPVVDSRFDLRAQLKISPQVLRADLNCGRHRLVIRNGAHPVKLRGAGFRSTVTLQPNTRIVALHRLKLDAPSLEVSGTLFQNRDRPEVRLDLSATGVQVAPLRTRLMNLLGDRRAVRNLFQVLTGGHVPLVSIHVRGKSFPELAKIENFTVRGSIVNGSVHVPGIDLDLEAVKGEAAIDKGLLKAKKLQAQMAQTIGYGGTLTLGLRGPRAPFLLDIETLADMQQLVPVLLRVVRNRSFQREMRRVAQISGKARGRLVIGDRLSSLAVDAEVSFADLHADYARLPQPVRVTGGSYHLSNRGLSFTNLQAVVGPNEFTNVSGSLDWKPSRRVRVTAAETVLSVPDFLDWLEKFPSWHSSLPDFNVLSGRVRLSDIYIDGPAGDTGQWRYDLSGVLTDARLVHSTESYWIPESRFTLRNPGNGATGVTIKPTRIQWADGWLEAAGIADWGRRSLSLDMDVKTETLSLALLEKTFGQWSASRGENPRALHGILSIHCEVFQFGNLNFGPVEAHLRMTAAATSVEISRADLCGISVPGSLRFTPDRIHLNLRPSSQGRAVEPVITCLSQKDDFITGSYEFSGRLDAAAKAADLLSELNGDVQFLATDGRIYRYNLLAKILALVNVTEILRGRLPDIGEDGFAYETIEARGRVQKGILHLQDLIIRGASMTIGIGGRIDLVNRTLDLKGFIAPLKTFDDIVQSLPVLNLIFENRHLVALPFSIRGEWENYSVVPLAASTSNADREGRTLESRKFYPQSVAPHEK